MTRDDNGRTHDIKGRFADESAAGPSGTSDLETPVPLPPPWNGGPALPPSPNPAPLPKPVPRPDAWSQATSLDVRDRIAAAGRGDLDAQGIRALMRDPEPAVRSRLLLRDDLKPRYRRRIERSVEGGHANRALDDPKPLGPDAPTGRLWHSTSPADRLTAAGRADLTRGTIDAMLGRERNPAVLARLARRSDLTPFQRLRLARWRR